MRDTMKCYITNAQLRKVYDFAKKMDNEGYLRPIREGGTENRNRLAILKNNVEGKIAEFGVLNWLNYELINKYHNISCSLPTDWVGDKNSFDSGYDLYLTKDDIEIPLEVKSSSLKAKSLMLEEERWKLNNDFEVINSDHKEKKAPFAFISVNVDMKWIEKNMLDGWRIKDNFIIEGYPQMFINGVLESETLKKCIKEKLNFFKKNEVIPTSQSTRLDAPNYIFPVYSNKLDGLIKMHMPEYGLNIIYSALTKKGL